MATAKKAQAQKSFLEDYSGQGLENVSPEDIIIPRIKLLQALSPELDANKDNFIKGAKVGEFVLTIPGISLGKEIELIPVQARTFWMEWEPGRGGLVGRHEVGSIEVDKSDYAHWTTPAGTEVQESRDWIVLLKGHEDAGACIMSFTSTMIKASKAWLTTISMERTPGGNVAPIFANIWKLSSVNKSNDKGSWYTVSTGVQKVRTITEKEFNTYVAPVRAAATAIQDNSAAQPRIEHEEGEVQAPKTTARKKTTGKGAVREIKY